MMPLSCFPPAIAPRRIAGVLLCVFLAWQTAGAAPRHPAKDSPAPSPAAVDDLSPKNLGMAPSEALPDPVASINGDPISLADLQRVTRALLATDGQTIEGLSPEDRQKAYRSVLDDIITDHLVAKKAVDEQVADVDVEKKFSELRSQYGTQEAFDAEIKKSGKTPEQIRHNIHTQLAQQAWIEHQIAPDIHVTPEEVEKFYKESPPNKFDAPEMLRASHILVGVRKDAPPEDSLAAEKKINDISDRLKKGESFESLAKQYSDDPNTKDRGGDLEYFSRERIMPEFADAAFKLKIGEVSAPVRTDFGFHLIKLTDRKPAHTATLDEARDQIAAYLTDEKRRAAIAKLVQGLKDQADIKIFL
jgi:peptidyl-prolyl cis-trans isomerase C